MSVLSLAAAFALGGAVSALIAYFTVTYWHRPLTVGPAAPVPLPEPNDFITAPGAIPVEPAQVKFRVIFYTENGSRARQLYEKLVGARSEQPHFAEVVELRHYADVRSHAP